MLPDAAPAPGKPERPEPDDNRKALVKRWGARIDQALKSSETLHKEFEKRRKRLRGIKTMENVEAVSNQERTNLVYSTLAALLPAVYAKNPDISVTPSEATPGSRYDMIKAFCQTMEAVLVRQFVHDAFLKKRAKACTRSAMTTSIGWAKVTYQRDTREDPIIQNRMNDIQDNIQRLQATIAAIEDPKQMADEEANKANLELQMQALAGQVEKIISEGLVIDNILSEDMLILDKTVRSFDGYRQAGAIAQRVWFTKEKFETQFGYAPEKATTYQTTAGDQKSVDATLGKEAALYAVFEIWDHDEDTVLTLCKGEEDFCREPYQPEKLGAHWYPYFPLAFNIVDGQFQPMSDVELLEKLSDEYNETRQQLIDCRQESLPSRYVRAGGGLTPEDVERVQNRKSREVVVLSGPGGKPLTDDIAEIGGVTVNPLLYDTTTIRGDLNLVSGSTDANQGAVLKAKTATEAEYLQSGLASRTGERQDDIADWIGDMAQYAAEILLQELTTQQAQRIAGESAVWPEMSKDEALDLVRIEIRAGSMGKPNKAKEQEQWTKVLPLIQEGMKEITELRAKGMNDMADAAVELLRETLRRFDERIDLDKFIPPPKKDAAPDAAVLMQQIEQMKQGMAELKKQADTNASNERVALTEAAGSVLTEMAKPPAASQPDVAAVVQGIQNKAAELQAGMPTAPAEEVPMGQPQVEQVH